jgi:hypothetical protein
LGTTHSNIVLPPRLRHLLAPPLAAGARACDLRHVDVDTEHERLSALLAHGDGAPRRRERVADDPQAALADGDAMHAGEDDGQRALHPRRVFAGRVGLVRSDLAVREQDGALARLFLELGKDAATDGGVGDAG